jgi:MoxR-like ATPase
MSLDWFRGDPDRPKSDFPVQIDSIDRDTFFGPDEYQADENLRDAVNTALLLDQPLLLTGEPGTGKTQLAEKLAHELGLELFKFETKSTSVAQDLFYTFDHVGRFREAQSPGHSATAMDPLNFIEFGALGRAVIQSLPLAEAQSYFPRQNPPAWFRESQRAVVLIDEIDKAPSEFPNDALNEIERHFFRIRELAGGLEVMASEKLRPIVVITSNSEKQLPDAFLRRCVFHHIQPIDESRLRRIAQRRLGRLGVAPGPLLDDALKLFFELRKPERDLRKPPTTAEFLAFLAALVTESGRTAEGRLDTQQAARWISTLVKAREDFDTALSFIKSRPAPDR